MYIKDITKAFLTYLGKSSRMWRKLFVLGSFDAPWWPTLLKTNITTIMMIKQNYFQNQNGQNHRAFSMTSLITKPVKSLKSTNYGAFSMTSWHHFSIRKYNVNHATSINYCTLKRSKIQLHVNKLMVKIKYSCFAKITQCSR